MYLASNVEDDNRDIMKRHYKARFLFLNWRRLNDTFYTDTFYLSVKSVQNYSCGQIYIGEKTRYWEVYPMKRESHAVISL